MNKIQERIILGLIFITYVIGLMAYPFLPDRMPIHWTLFLIPDRYSGKLEALFVPTTAIFFVVFTLLIKQIGVKSSILQVFLLRFFLTILAFMIMVFQIIGALSQI